MAGIDHETLARTSRSRSGYDFGQDAGFTVGGYTQLRQAHSDPMRRRFTKRANTVTFYRDHGRLQAHRVPESAPVPGYEGVGTNQNTNFGNSKAFGLPMKVMEIPPTPSKTRDEASVLADGFGPGGKHRIGASSLFAGMGKQEFQGSLDAKNGGSKPDAGASGRGAITTERRKAMEHHRMERITGMGKRAPFDFVPGDGLVQECHTYSHARFHRNHTAHGSSGSHPRGEGFASPAAAGGRGATTSPAADKPHRLRRPRGTMSKGYAPVAPAPPGAVGTIKYSVFQLPTLREIKARKEALTRV